MSAVVSHNFDMVIARMLKKAEDFRQPLTDFYGYMLRRTQLTFSKLGRKGNTMRFRDVLWPWFAPQYTRKDGTVIPAEGGVIKVLGDGIVKGRKRHSGTRVTARSMILQDRGGLKHSALSRYRINMRNAVFETTVDYAKYHQKKRPHTFVTDSEVDYLRQLLIKHLIE